MNFVGGNMKKVCSLLSVVILILLSSTICLAGDTLSNTGFIPSLFNVTTPSGDALPPFYSGTVVINLPSGETFETEIFTLKSGNIKNIISNSETSIQLSIAKKLNNSKMSNLISNLTFVSLLEFVLQNSNIKKSNEELIIIGDKINNVIESVSKEIITDLNNNNFEKLQVTLFFTHEFYKIRKSKILYLSHQKIFNNIKSFVINSKLINLKNNLDINGALRVAEGDEEGSAIAGAIVGGMIGAGVAAAGVCSAPAAAVVVASAAACAAGAAATTAIANAASSLGDWAGSN